MNYMWTRADRASRGMIVYRPTADTTITQIDPAGDLHVRLSYDDGTHEVLPRNAWIMVQVYHRRCYETSNHHWPIL